LLDEYLTLISKFQGEKIAVEGQKQSGYVQRFFEWTSSWDVDDRSGSNGQFVLWFGSIAGTILTPTIALPILLSSAWYIPLGLAAGVAATYKVFLKEHKLKGLEYHRESRPDELVMDAYRLNYLAQVMIKEMEDIENVDESQLELMREQHGVEGLIRYMEKPLSHARQVREYTGRILTAAKVKAPVLSPDYVPSALRDGVEVVGLSEEIDVAYEKKVVALSS